MEKGPSVISRGFQLKHIPSGAVRPCSFVCVCGNESCTAQCTYKDIVEGVFSLLRVSANFNHT